MDYEQKEQGIRAEMVMDKIIDQFKKDYIDTFIEAVKSEYNWNGQDLSLLLSKMEIWLSQIHKLLKQDIIYALELENNNLKSVMSNNGSADQFLIGVLAGRDSAIEIIKSK